MKKVFKIALISVAVIIFISVVVTVWMAMGLNDIQAMVINEVDINGMQDGTYAGNFDGRRWSNELEVEIEGQKITSIKIVNDIKFPMEGIAEKVFNQVIEEQSTAVDVISGATVTSKAYLKSIENALLLR
ncbi:MAG: FMN-binding protein [Clostridia bacterium]|nr:FMN-binding protein [Clostridia bacterium]